MARLNRRIGLVLLLAPAAARSQDLTALAALVLPPLLVVPLLVAWLRAKLLLPSNGTSSSIGVLLAFGAAELVLWLAIAGCAALVYFAERSAVVAFAALAALTLVSTIRLVGAPHASWRFTAAMVLAFPVTWLLVQLTWYLGALLLS